MNTGGVVERFYVGLISQRSRFDSCLRLQFARPGSPWAGFFTPEGAALAGMNAAGISSASPKINTRKKAICVALVAGIGFIQPRKRKMIEEKPLSHHRTTAAPNSHYAAMKLEPIEAMKAWMSQEQMTGFLLGNVIKYLARFNCAAPGKGGETDLLKARDYLNQLINLEGQE